MIFRFSSLLRVVIGTVALFSLCAYVLQGLVHPYFNRTSLVLILLLGLTLHAYSGRFTSRRPPAIVITLTLILFVQLRLAVLIVLPESLLGHANVTSGMINTTLGYMICGTVACYLGLAAGYGRIRTRNQASATGSNTYDGKFWILAVLFLALLALSLSTYFQFGYIGATGDGTHLGFFQRYIARLISPQMLFVMCLSVYLACSRRGIHRFVFAGLLIVYGLSFVARGSRSGVFEIIILLLAGKLSFDGDFRMKVSFGKGVLLALLLPVVIATYVIPTQLRAFWYGEDVATNSLAEGFSLAKAPELVSDISYRLSFIEPTLFPAFTRELGLSDVSHLVNLRTSLLSSVNRLIPGKPFGDILFSEYAFGYLCNAETGVQVAAATGRVDHVGYEWSMYGLGYQLFGYVGGTAFIFGFTALLGWILRWCQKSTRFSARIYGVFFTTVLVIWVRNLGLDNLVDAVGHNLFLLWLYVLVYGVLALAHDRIARKVPVPPRPPELAT